jgi:hypothetical protein
MLQLESGSFLPDSGRDIIESQPVECFAERLRGLGDDRGAGLHGVCNLTFVLLSPTVSKHYATIVLLSFTNLVLHIRVRLPRRFPELAVFDARLDIRVRRIDEPV